MKSGGMKGACVTESEDIEGVWHSVGHLTLNERVGGSSPSRCTSKSFS